MRMAFDSFFQSKRARRQYRIGIPPSDKPEPETPTDYGPKLTADEWRNLSHPQRMALLSKDAI